VPQLTETALMKNLLAATTIFALSASTAAAQFITPTGTFGPKPAAVTFGGSGIPGPVMSTTLTNGPLLVIGASQRFDNAPLTNDGAGTYFAAPGTDINTVNPQPGFARWNFNFHISGQNTGLYNYRLFYDFNPADGSTQDQASYGVVRLLYPLFDPQSNTSGVVQGSWNLGMGFLTAGNGLDVVPPSFSFSALTAGTYSFALVAYTPVGDRTNPFGTEVGRVAMNVSVVPEPASIVLMATGLIGTGLVVRRRRRTTAAVQV